MSEQVIVRGPGEGRTLLVGGGDYVTYKATSSETGGDFFSFEMSTVPGFGPPLHKHAYRELFYVLEGSYEFTVLNDDDRTETMVAGAGTSVAMPPLRPHTFRNATDGPARMLCVQQHATLEGFFEEFGVPVAQVGDSPDTPGSHGAAGTPGTPGTPGSANPPDFAGMAAALERNGVTVVGAPEVAR